MPPVSAAYDGSTLLDWSWVTDHTHDIWIRTQEHLVLTGWSILLGVLIAVPLAVLAQRRRRLLGPLLVGTGVLYTIPSLAAFALLLPFTGLSRSTAIIPLTTYTLLILVRNVVTGLDGVPADVKEAATGMGYRPWRRLVAVELPLALPAAIAGVRIATVTIIGMVPVAALVGQGGLGALMLDGFDRDFQTPLTVGVVLTVVLAVAADALLIGAQRLAMPWSRRAAV